MGLDLYPWDPAQICLLVYGQPTNALDNQLCMHNDCSAKAVMHVQVQRELRSSGGQKTS